MASREALAIRRDAAMARIVEAIGDRVDAPPPVHRDPDVARTEFIEWAADAVEALVADAAKARADAAAARVAAKQAPPGARSAKANA